MADTPTHIRAIGNPKEHKGPPIPKSMIAEPPRGMTVNQRGGPCNYGSGVDPRAGVTGNWKSRRHYPVGQVAEFCMRSLWRERDGKEQRCKKRKNCGKCVNMSEYEPEYRRSRSGKGGKRAR